MSNFYLEWLSAEFIATATNNGFTPLTNDFSVSAWIKTLDSAGFIMGTITAGNADSWMLEIVASEVRLRIEPGAIFSVTSNTIINDNEWHHVAATVDRSDNMLIYVDGELDGAIVDISGDQSSLPNPAGLFMGDHTFQTSYIGSTDDTRFYNGVILTPTQINNIYNNGRGEKVNEDDFKAITSNGWYSNIDNNPDLNLSSRSLISDNWASLVSVGDKIDGVKIAWFEGGFPILPDNISTANLAGMKIGVATSQITNDKTFDSPVILMISYVDNNIVQPQLSYSPNLNLGGVPLSVSLCYDPTLDITTGDTVGFFHALDIIETFEDAEVESDDETIVPATFSTFSGNRLQVSRISNNYYLNVVRLGETSAPINPITLQGISMATGNNNELILRKDISAFHIDDIGTNPETGELDIKLVNIGGTPLSAGRIGNKYYLIVKPVANP